MQEKALIRAQILAQYRRSFSRHWRPEDNSYSQSEFEMELDTLIYAAFACAQEPFIKELDFFRENTLKLNLFKDDHSRAHASTEKQQEKEI